MALIRCAGSDRNRDKQDKWCSKPIRLHHKFHFMQVCHPITIHIPRSVPCCTTQLHSCMQNEHFVYYLGNSKPNIQPNTVQWCLVYWVCSLRGTGCSANVGSSSTVEGIAINNFSAEDSALLLFRDWLFLYWHHHFRMVGWSIWDGHWHMFMTIYCCLLVDIPFQLGCLPSSVMFCLAVICLTDGWFVASCMSKLGFLVAG